MRERYRTTPTAPPRKKILGLSGITGGEAETIGLFPCAIELRAELTLANGSKLMLNSVHIMIYDKLMNKLD